MKSILQRKWPILILLVVVSLVVSYSLQPREILNANASWNKIGEGHLTVYKDGTEHLAYPSPATYFKKGKGAKKKDFYLKTKKAYGLNKKKDKFDSTPLEISDVVVERGQLKIPVIKVNQKMFLTKKEKTLRTAKGKIIAEDDQFANLYSVDQQANVTPLFNESEIHAAQQSANRKNLSRDEHKLNVIWAAEPHLMKKGTKIAFASNKDNLPNGKDDTSVYVMNEDGSDEVLLIDSATYGNQNIIGASEDTIVTLNPNKFNLLVADVNQRTVKEHPIQGWGESVSPSGRYVIFRKVVDMTILPDLYMFDVESQQETKITGMPTNYFFNMNGEWSEDSRYYAFIANGNQQLNKKNTNYRDNNLLVVIDTRTMSITSLGTPEQSASLYPSSSLSWIDSTHIVTYVDDDTSWVAEIKMP